MMTWGSEMRHLRRCVELASEALDAGDEPFGSVLVSSEGTLLFEDRNRVTTAADPTRHPEIEIARWAAANMSVRERASSTVFTSGEHCPMCATAHALVGLDRIVYVSSSSQLTNWLTELGIAQGPVMPLSIQQVAPGLSVEGPVTELLAQVRDLHYRFHGPPVYSVTIVLLNGDKRVVRFKRHAYNNLMELIVNELYENIGDCKGHAWCGTCHVEIVSGELNEEMNRDESMTLEKLPNTVPASRLACQIMTDELIDSMVFRVLGDV